MLVWVLRLPLVGWLVALPLDEPATDRVVFQLVKLFVAGEKHRRHGIGMMEVTLRSVEDNVLQRKVESRRAERDLVTFIGICGQPVQELGRARCRSFPEQSGQRCSVGAMTLPCGAQT